MGPTLFSLLLIISLSAASAACAPRTSPYDTVLNGFLAPPMTFTDSDGGSLSPSSSPTAAPTPSRSPTSPASPTPKAVPSTATTAAPSTATTAATTAAPSTATTTATRAPDSESDSESESNTESGGLLGKIGSAVDATISTLIPKEEASLGDICGKTPSPELCSTLVQAGASSIKSKPLDVRAALRIVLERLVDETRDTRDKSRALATSTLEEDPLNTCNRSLGYCLRNTKEAIEKLDAGDERSMKTNFDAYSNSIGNCKDEPIPVQEDAKRLFSILLICNELLVSLHPSISREAMFPEQFTS